MEPVKIGYSSSSGQMVVSVAGEIDLSVKEDLSAALDEAIENADGHNVIVDLSQTRFIDSTGLRVLVDGRKKAAEAQVPYGVVGASGMVRRVIEITGLTQALIVDEG